MARVSITQKRNPDLVVSDRCETLGAHPLICLVLGYRLLCKFNIFEYSLIPNALSH